MDVYDAQQVPSPDAPSGVRTQRRRDYRLKVYKSRLVRIVIIGVLAALLPQAFSNPSNFLAIDGSIIHTPTSTATYDWGNGGNLSGTNTVGSVWSRDGAGGVFNGGVFEGTTTPPRAPTLTPAAAADPTIANAEFVVDPLSTDVTPCGTGDPTTFLTPGADKNDLPISGFQWGLGTSGAKAELSNAYALSHVDGSTNEIFFGAERVVNNGDSHVDFEFLQSPVATNAGANGCAPAGGGTFSGHRTEGDLLISADFTNGGSFGGIDLARWQCGTTAGPNGVVCDPTNGSNSPQYVTISTSTVNVAINSTGPTGCGGWVCRDANGNGITSVDTNEFFEGGIDLAGAGFADTCFSTFLPHTRESQQITSSLVDFAGPFNFSNCKTPNVATTLSSGNQSGTHVTVSAGASVSDTAVLSNTAGTPKGTVTYTVYSASDCSTTSTVTSQAVTVNANGTVPSTSNIAFPTGGTFYFQAAYSGDAAQNGKNLPAISPCTAEVLTVNAAHITITKTADATPVDDGMPIGFTVTATNTGAGDANGVTIHDPLPHAPGVSWVIDPPSGQCTISGTAPNQVLNCSFGTLTSGQSASVHILSATDSTTGTQHLVNVASVTTTNDGSGSATATVDVRAAHINLVKTADQDPVNDGMPIGFTITATSNGQAAATSVTVNDPLPPAPGVHWVVDAAGSTPGCSITGPDGSQVLTCNFGTLASGASAHVHITSGTDGTTGMRTLQNVASVTTTNDGSDTATATVHTLAAQIGVTKTADASPVDDGSPIGFTIAVGNSGAAPATTVTVNDPLPAAPGINWAIDPANPTPGCSITGAVGSQVLHCDLGTIGSKASVSIHIVSPTTGATGMRTVTNTASAASGNDGSATSTAHIDILAASVHVVKTADQSVVSAGDLIGFTITATNTGPAAATTVTVTDTLTSPAGVVWAAVPSQGSCGIVGTLLTCDLGTLAANGGQATIHLTSPTTAASCGSIKNTAFITSGNDGSGASDPVLLTIECPDIAVTKTAVTPVVDAGDVATFQIVVTNLGPGTAANVTATDVLPAGLSWTSAPVPSGNPNPCTISLTNPEVLNCNFGTMAAGTSQTETVSATTSGANCGPLVNTARISATNQPATDFFDTHNHSTATITVNCANIGITKTADATPVSAGDPIGFTILVQNTGAGTATTVTVTDTLQSAPGVSWTASASQGSCSIVSGLLTCDLGSLASGGTATIHLTSPTTGASCTTIDNTAFVTTGNDGSGNSSASITIDCPNLGVTKTAISGTVNAGDTASFQIVVTNSGPGTAATATVNDPLPAGVTWTITSQSPVPACSITAGTLSCNFGALGPNVTFTVVVSGKTTAATCGTLTNTVTVTAVNAPLNQAGLPTVATSTASIDVNCAQIHIAKSADTDPVSAGDPIGFTIQVQNTGQGQATGVVVTDTLTSPTGVVWTAMPSQGSCTIVGDLMTCDLGDLAAVTGTASIHLTSPTTAESCTTISNVAFVAVGNDGVATSLPATIHILCPSLGVTKTAFASTVSAGDPNQLAEFTIVVANAGPGTAKGVTFTDTLPGAGPWGLVTQDIHNACTVQGGTVLVCANIGDLGPGTSFTVVVGHATTEADCGPLVNTVTVTATNQITEPTSGATITVECPHLTIVKTADQASVQAGDPVGFTITVTNTGPGAAQGVIVTDTLSPLASNWSVTGPQGCGISGNELICALPNVTLLAGGIIQIHVVGTSNPNVCASIENQAFVSDPLAVTPTAISSLVVSTQVLCPNVGVTKTAVSDTITAGDTAAFNILVANTGSGSATGVQLHDPLPAGVTWTLTANPGNLCGITAQPTQTVLDCNFGTLTAGQSYLITVSGATTKANCGMLVNTAHVTAANQLFIPDSQAIITVVCPQNPPKIHVHKKADDNPESAGEQIGFTIEVSNSGGEDATGVVLTDHLPTAPGIHWTIDGQVNGCSITDNVLTCTRDALGAGDHFTVHVVSGTSFLAFCDTLHNTARVTSDNGGSDESSAEIHIKCAHITVTKKADDNPESRGEQIGFTIVVKNTGEDGLLDPSLTDDLPTGTGIHWTIANPVAGCSIADNTLTCHQAWLDPDGGSFTVHVISPTTFQTECTTLHNTAHVSSTNGGTDQDSAEIQIKCANLTVEKHADDKSVTEGGQIGFTITVKNTGDDGMLNPSLNDPLPTGDGISWQIAEPVAGCSIADNTLTCHQAWLDPDGGSFTVHVISATGAASCGTYDNHATASATNASDAQDSAELEVTGCPEAQGTSTVQTNGGPGTDVLGAQFGRQPTQSQPDQVVPAVTHALLPFTGFNAAGTGLLALVLLAAGGVLVVIDRRRKTKQDS